MADNEKSVSRAYREIDRLDKQLEVSLLEYNHVNNSVEYCLATTSELSL